MTRSAPSRAAFLPRSTAFMHAMRATLLAASIAVGLSACGGGGSSNAGPAGDAGSALASTAASGNAGSSAATGTTSTAQPGDPSTASSSNPPAGAGSASSGAASTAGAASPGTQVPTELGSFRYFRLGGAGPAGTASLQGGTLFVDGKQSSNARLIPGACNGGSAFSQCASMASANVFTLCSSDGGAGPGTDRVRSRYVLIDPAAERVGDASVLRNLSFSGFENCGENNVGAQPKSAPSATLHFNANGDLTLTRFDQDPARSTTLPSFVVDLNNDTVSGGQTAHLALYRSNGRYLIVATSAPTTGPTASDPGTLIAFIQN